MKLLILFGILCLTTFAQQTDNDDSCPLFTAEVRKLALDADTVYQIHFVPVDQNTQIESVEVQYSMTTEEDIAQVMANEQFQFAHRMSLVMDSNTMKPSFMATLPAQLVVQGGTLVLKFIYATQIDGTDLHCVSEINIAEIPVPSEDTMPTHAAQPVRGGGFGGFGGFRGGMGMGMGAGGFGGGFGRWRQGRFPWGRGYPGMGMYPPYGFPAGGGGFPTGFPGGDGFPDYPPTNGDECADGEMLAEDGTCVPIPTTGGRGTRRGGTSPRRENRCPEGYTYDTNERICEKQEPIRSRINFAAPVQLTETREGSNSGNPYQSAYTSRVQAWYS